MDDWGVDEFGKRPMGLSMEPGCVAGLRSSGRRRGGRRPARSRSRTAGWMPSTGRIEPEAVTVVADGAGVAGLPSVAGHLERHGWARCERLGAERGAGEAGLGAWRAASMPSLRLEGEMWPSRP